jgi:hypothetical protein
MPAKKPIHPWLCQQLGIACKFPWPQKCPLDEPYWKRKHHHGRKYIIPFEGRLKITSLDSEQCVEFLNVHLERLERLFNAFSQLPDEQARLCWTAHMICDHASDYYWEAREKDAGKRSLNDLFYHDPEYKQFLLAMGGRFIKEGRFIKDQHSVSQ